MNTTPEFEIINAVGTDQQIAELAERAIADATRMGWKGLTLWFHEASDKSDITPTVTVRRIEE